LLPVTLCGEVAQALLQDGNQVIGGHRRNRGKGWGAGTS
jgi:hypothetical protein